MVYSDLRKDFGEIKDQGEVGWCYAYTTADLLNHKLARFNGKSNTTPVISPRAIALNYISEKAANKKIKVGEVFLNNSSLNELSGKIDRNYVRSHRLQTERKLFADNDTLEHMQSRLDKLKSQSGPNASIDWLGRRIRAKKEFGSIEAIDKELRVLESERAEALAQQKRISTAISSSDDLIAGGVQSKTIGQALGGMCTEKDIPSGDITYAKKWQGINNYLREFGGISDGVALQELYLFQKNAEDAAKVCRSAIMAHVLSPNETLKSFQDIFSAQVGIDPIKAILDKCKERGVVYSADFKSSFKIQESYVDFKTPEPAQKAEAERILKAVDKHILNEPVAIMINPDILKYSADVYPQEFDRNKFALLSHAVTVVGAVKSCKSGEEEYIIRNSWGKNACANDVAKMSDSAPFRCVDGYYIIPKSHIKKGFIGATLLKDTDKVRQ